jgi:hypothetical protein
MRCRHALPALVAIVLAATTANAQGKYTLEVKDAPPPKELAADVSKLLETKALVVGDEKKEVMAEVWLRKAIPVKADPAKLAKGAAYEHLEYGMIVGAMRLSKPAGDYRKQTIRPGVYTLRYATQPQDGSHMGTAPNPEFVVLVSAELDKEADVLDKDTLNEISGKSIKRSHPGIFLLFPYGDMKEDGTLKDEGKGHWVVRRRTSVDAKGKPFPLGMALVIAGHTQE